MIVRIHHQAVLVVLLSLVIGATPGVDTVDLYGVFETTTTNTTAYANKFRDVDLEATFVSPSGREIPFWGYFDGDGTGGPRHFDATDPIPDHAGEMSGTVWGLRFMPDEVGDWSFTWRFSDGSASGGGSFTCVDPAGNHRRGVLRPQPGNPHWLVDARGQGFLPKTLYQRDSNRAHYYHIDDYQANWDRFIDQGFNMLAFNWLPVWTEVINPNPANGPHDANVFLWRHLQPIDISEDRVQIPGETFDTDRINIFAIRRVEQHVRYLADQGVYTWGFQGFNCKRSVAIFPHNFPDEKYAWYVRYCMARLAPFYNVLWNNTWESSNGASDFRRLTRDEGYDPWQHMFFGLGQGAGSVYEVEASDRRFETVFDLNRSLPDPVTKPVWSMESNGMWPSQDADTGWLIYKFHAVGISPTWVEWNLTKGAENAPTWDQYMTTAAATTVKNAYATLEEELDLARMAPQHDLIAPTAAGRCLSEAGKQYLVVANGVFSLDLPSGDYRELWVDWNSNARRGPTAFTWSGGPRDYSTDGDFQVLIIQADAAGDTTPPSQVTGLTAQAISDIRVDLAWQAATDPESGVVRYTILRDGDPLGTTQSLAYIDDTVSAHTTYTYRVAAVNGVGLSGSASDPATVTTPAFNEPPSVSVSAPSDGASHHAGDPLFLSAVADDVDGTVASVAFLVIHQGGGIGDVVFEQTDTDGSDGWSVTWPTPPVDDYDITAIATDDGGKSTESTVVVLQVVNGAPIIDAIGVETDPVTDQSTRLSVTASDPDGDEVDIQWVASTTPAGATPTIASGEDPLVTFDLAGDYVFTVTASDGLGGTVSDAVAVTVVQTAASLEISP